MGVTINFITLVIPKTVLQHKYKGGINQYKLDCPNKSFKEDDYLTRISFMGSEGLDEVIKKLEACGVDYDRANNVSKEFVIVSFAGWHWSIPWLIIRNGKAYHKNDYIYKANE